MWKYQLKLATKYLLGRKQRSILTTLSIVIGTMVILGTNIMLPTMMQSFQSNVQAISGQVDVTLSLTTGEAFSRNMVNKVNRIPGIKAISGSLSRVVNIPAGYYPKGNISTLNLTGIVPQAAEKLRNYPVAEGRFLSSGDTHAAVITRSLADELGLTLGDRLGLPTTDGNVNLKIVGLLPARSIPGNEEVLVSLQEAQGLLNLPARINTIEINLDTLDNAQREQITGRIQAAVGEDYTLGALAAGSELMASMQAGQMAFNMIGILSLFMGAFIIFNTFRTIVAERRHDIGMLRALGATRKTIVGLFLVEGLAQGIAGTAVGMVLGYLLGAGTMLLMSSIFESMLHLKVGTPVVTPGVLLLTAVAGIGMTLLAGLLPAMSASRITPLEALRPAFADTSHGYSRRKVRTGIILSTVSVLLLVTGNVGLIALGVLLILAGVILMAPAFIRPLSEFFSRYLLRWFTGRGTGVIARSNLVRNPSRSAVTASSTMIGLAVIVGLGGMIWSITGGFLDVLQRSLGSDYLVMPPAVAVWGSNVGAKEDLANRLRAVPGVDVVSTMRFAHGALEGQQFSMLGIEPASYTQVAGLTFVEGDPQEAYAAMDSGQAVILNGILASTTGHKVGDTIQLSTARGVKDYLVAGIAGDYLNAKIMTAYISQTNLYRDYHKNEDIFYQINLKDGADEAQAFEKLQKVLKNYPQFKLVSGQGYFEENKQLFNAVFAFYFVLLGVLTAPSLMALLNTLSIGVIERTREIGMLRAIGATRKQVRRMVVAESLLLSLVGTIFGLITGMYMGYLMVLALKVYGFPVQFTLPWQGLIAATVTGVVFGLVAASLPSKQAENMEIVQALRYE